MRTLSAAQNQKETCAQSGVSGTSKPMKFTLILMLALTAAGCGSTPQLLSATPCEGLDWFEIGRRDGTVGRPITRLSDHIRDCAKGIPPDADMYINGRNVGLLDYCTAQSGLEFGKAGMPYELVCPEHLEPNFLPNYKIGRKQYLEEEKSRTKTASGTTGPSILNIFR